VTSSRPRSLSTSRWTVPLAAALRERSCLRGRAEAPAADDEPQHSVRHLHFDESSIIAVLFFLQSPLSSIPGLGGARLGPVSVRKLRYLAMNAGLCGPSWGERKTAHLQGHSAQDGRRGFCLPCRRSRVRIPSAALKRPAFAGLFCVRSRLVRLSRVGLTPDSPRADRRPFREKRLFAGRFWFVRTEVLLRACRRSGVRSAAAVRPTPAATPRSCRQRPPARYQRSRSLGPVRFQSGNREVNLDPLRDPGEPWHREP
jgi:hypothetical protein